MNNIIGLSIALFLPAILGFSWLHLIWKQSHLAARVGYGYLVGVCISVLIVYLWSIAGLSLQFLPLTLVILVLTLIPVYLRKTRFQDHNTSSNKSQGILWEQLLWWFLLVLLIIRFSGLFLEETWRPLYPWDAWMNWAPKAKVWFELREITPFVHYFAWPEDSLKIGAYTLGNPDASAYPPLIPLLQTWTSLGIGEWRDTWVNFSWFLCVVAFFLAFYGQLRMLQMSSLWSMISAYLLFSMPYLNTHVALAGYAELWLAAFYCGAVMALVNWSQTGSRIQLILVLLMIIACIFTKKPGIVWAATLLLGLLLRLLPIQFRYALIALGLAGIGFVIVNEGLSLRLPSNQVLILSFDIIQIPYLGTYPLEYHPISEYFLKNTLQRGNWHALFWLVIISMPITLISVVRHPHLRESMVTLSSGVIFIFIVFFFTNHYQSAIDSTTINRALFHILPALFYFTVTSLWLFVTNQRSDIVQSKAPMIN